MTAPRPHPAALPHGELTELFPGIHFVTGTVAMKAPLPIRFSRNMTVVAEDGALTLINTLRLDEPGLRAMEALGEVRHVIRLAGFHGVDDPFYAERYGARVWSVDAPYAPGFNQGPPYFTPDEVLTPDSVLPLTGARLLLFQSATPGEGLLYLDCDGGIIVSGDCLQNWARPDRYFSLPARLIMRPMGFIKPHNIGPGWLKSAKPDSAEIRDRLALDFEHVLPAHGTPVLGGASEKYSAALERLA